MNIWRIRNKHQIIQLLVFHSNYKKSGNLMSNILKYEVLAKKFPNLRFNGLTVKYVVTDLPTPRFTSVSQPFRGSPISGGQKWMLKQLGLIFSLRHNPLCKYRSKILKAELCYFGGIKFYRFLSEICWTWWNF